MVSCLTRLIFVKREMMFEQLFCDNCFSHAHIVFLLFLSIDLIFVQIPIFLWIFWLSTNYLKK